MPRSTRTIAVPVSASVSENNNATEEFDPSLGRTRCVCNKLRSRRNKNFEPCNELCPTKQFYCSSKCRDEDKQHVCIGFSKDNDGFITTNRIIKPEEDLMQVPELLVFATVRTKYKEDNATQVLTMQYGCIVCKGFISVDNNAIPQTNQPAGDYYGLKSRCRSCNWPVCGDCVKNIDHKTECMLLTKLRKNCERQPINEQPEIGYLLLACIKVSEMKRKNLTNYDALMKLDVPPTFKLKPHDSFLLQQILDNWQDYLYMLNISKDEAKPIIERILLYKVDYHSLGLDQCAYGVLPVIFKQRCESNSILIQNKQNYFMLKSFKKIEENELICVFKRNVTRVGSGVQLWERKQLPPLLDGNLRNCDCDVCKKVGFMDERNDLYARRCLVKTCKGTVKPEIQKNGSISWICMLGDARQHDVSVDTIKFDNSLISQMFDLNEVCLVKPHKGIQFITEELRKNKTLPKFIRISLKYIRIFAIYAETSNFAKNKRIIKDIIPLEKYLDYLADWRETLIKHRSGNPQIYYVMNLIEHRMCPL